MMRKPIVPLRRDERGASLIEMALTAPVLAALLIGMTDLSRAFSMKLGLEQAAQRTIEKVAQQKSVATDYSSLQTEGQNAATAAGYSGSTVTVDFWLECNGARQGSGMAAFNGSCPNATDVTARYVTVEITNSFTPMFGTKFFRTAVNGKVPLSGESGVRIQ